MSKEKLVSSIAIGYFITGVVFASAFALYYRWSLLSFFSPGFYSVIFTWPIQTIGLFNDLLNYGLTGKPI